MAKYTPVYTHEPNSTPPVGHTAILANHPAYAALPMEASQDAAAAISALALQIPDLAFTFEVDILGNHRITVHFKGADITVDDTPY